MNLPLTLGLASASATLLLSGALISYLMIFRRFTIPCCGRRPDTDEERGPPPPNSRVADEPAKGSEPAVRRFEWEEIQSLTGGFTAAVIGEGGFSTVYLARLPDSTLTALKVLRSSERLHRAFLLELDVLLHVRHPNIVQLLGYSDDREEGVLVFEYVPNGTLHDRLHGDGGGGGGLTWCRRMSIAFQIAAAVDYLHDGCDLQIVHGDITASNVLLDGKLDPKLCDFGFARMGFSGAVQPRAGPMVGSPGYADPHYLRTGIISKKSDVYSFGVLVLELLTGISAFQSEEEQLLTAVMAPKLRDAGSKVGDMVDPRLGGNFDAEEAVVMAAVAAKCIGDRPGLRPSMAEILRIMRDKASASMSAVGGESDGKAVY